MALEGARVAKEMSYFVYILWSDQLSKFYVGSTQNIENRLKEHNKGEGSFSSKGIPWKLIWSFELMNRSEAVRLENKIKKRGIKRFLENNSGSSAGR
jgi:putative endonuclease